MATCFCSRVQANRSEVECLCDRPAASGGGRGPKTRSQGLFQHGEIPCNFSGTPLRDMPKASGLSVVPTLHRATGQRHLRI